MAKNRIGAKYRGLNLNLTIYWLWGLGKSVNSLMPRFPYLKNSANNENYVQ